MRAKSISIPGLALVAVLGASAGFAQTQNLLFSYQGSANPTPVAIAPGGDIPFPNTAVGSSTTINLIVTNQGSTSVTVTSVTVSNSAFLAPSGSTPIAAGGTGTITLGFAPQTAGAASGILTVQVGPQSYMFNLNGATAASTTLVTSYILNPGGNQVQIGNGGTIAFASTLVGSTATATFIISNPAGAPAAGTVSSVTISSGAFSISGLPLLPQTIAAGGQLQFTITFAPTVLGAQTGTLTLQAGSTQATIRLTGTGTGPVFTYQTISGSTTTTIVPNGTITFPDTTVGQTSGLTIAVKNTGDASGQITAVSSIGNSAFVVADLLPLPTTVAPGATITFQLQFIPSAVGSMSGRLLINGNLFNLNAVGLGSVLSVSLSIASTTTPVPNGGIALFPNTTVGAKQQGTFTVTNAGNVTATVSTISVTGASFALGSTPALPSNLSPGTALSFPVTFSPNGVGTLTGTLAINNLVFNLQGIGTNPPALPAYSFTGASGTATPLQQPSIGLQLAAPYPMELSGTLTLSFASAAFVDDPGIQFSTGGRSVKFTIPANTTTALFGQSQQIQFQVGSIAGAITVTPAFTIGSVNLTPNTPTVLTLQVPTGPPQIRTVQIGNTTSSSFQVLITGYSTPRSVTGLALNFSGSGLQNTSLSISSDSAFSSWYQTTASTTVGSQFTATVTINVSGNVRAVQSVSVVASNAQGSSSSVSANLP